MTRDAEAAGLYDQEPALEDGNFFLREWIEKSAYDSVSQLPAGLRNYSASDHAISERRDASFNCFVPVGVDYKRDIWVYPDVYWKRSGVLEAANEWINLIRRREPIVHWAEKGHISQCIGPFLKEKMDYEQVWAYIKEITPVRDKETRAQVIRGLMSMYKVHLPRFAPWYEKAVTQLLSFPGGTHNDFVDTLGHIGREIRDASGASAPRVELTEQLNVGWRPTFKWMKESDRRQRKEGEVAYGGR